MDNHSANIQQENEQLIAELHRLQEEHEHLIDLLDQHAFKLTEANCEVAAIKAKTYQKPGIFKQLTDRLGFTKHRLHYDITMSGHFDELWYLQTYPDVAKSGINPIHHYLKFGAKEGRNPSPSFHTHWYLRTYPDVMAKGFNPLVHYINYGKKEGRYPQQNPRFFTNPTESRIRWLSDMLAESKVTYEKLEQQCIYANQQLEVSNTERRAVVAQYESQIQVLQTQISDLHQQLEASNTERREVVAQYELQVQILQTQATSLHQQLEASDTERRDVVAKYESKVQILQTQATSLHQQLDVSNAERRSAITRYESQIQVLQTQISDLHQQLDTSNTERRNAAMQYETQVHILQTQVSTLGQQLGRSDEERRQITGQYNSLQKEYLNAVKDNQAKIRETDQQLNDASKTVQNFEAYVSKLNAETNTNRLFLHSQLQELKNTLAE